MATRFQQLGAFVNVSENLSEQRVKDFADVGGRWIVVLLDQLSNTNGPEVAYNQAHIEDLKTMCKRHGVAVGGWFTGWAGPPEADAATVAAWTKAHNLGPVCLNLEAPYQAQPSLLPPLVAGVRRRLTTRSIFVSTNSFNDSLIWNGGSLGPASSMLKLSVRVAPQWYSSPLYSGPWFHPDLNMAWLRQHGSEDNFHCATCPGERAVPASYVHGTLEATGVEGSSLSVSLAELHAATVSGFTKGFSVYTLEQMPDSDLSLLEAVRGILYLV